MAGILHRMGDVFLIRENTGVVLGCTIQGDPLIVRWSSLLNRCAVWCGNTFPNRLNIESLGTDLPSHWLCCCQHGEAYGGEAHRQQKPRQNQPPQGILHTPGNGIAEKPPQKQQCCNQYGGCEKNFFHDCVPSALSRIAASSARSSSLSARLSTRLLTISPRLPP